jgi:short subunit dehydrogenase-like uncharacterized protein
MTNAPPSAESPIIAVYGAYGYTGALVVAELARRGLRTIVIGRDAERLRDVAAAGALGTVARVAALDDARGLADALADADVVINAAGPFGRTVEAVVGAAIRSRTHYVDTSGEQRPTKLVFDAFAAAAAEAGVSVVPGTADDGLPTNLAAQVAADQLAAVEDISIAVSITGGVTRGSVRSLHDALAGATLDYEDGEWRPATPRTATITFPNAEEPTPVSTFPLPAVITVPRHVAARRVWGLLDDELIAALHAIDPASVALMPLGPPAEQRRTSRWSIVVDASDGTGGNARAWAQGPDGYRLTAVIAVEAAVRVATDGAPAGTLAAAQAFDPAGFLDALAEHGVEWGVESTVAAGGAA